LFLGIQREDHPMISLKSLGRGAAVLAAVATLGGATAAQAQRPDARIEFNGGSVAFLLGVHWGGGTVIFRGHRYPVRVNGLKLGSIGGSSFRAVGEVYHLHNIKDIEGTYGAAGASATAGAGAGVIDMTNGNGVEIRAHSTSAGLQLTLAVQGVDIRLR